MNYVAFLWVEVGQPYCRSFLLSIALHNNPLGLSVETWLANCLDCHIRSICHFSQKDWESAFVDYTGF